jgi:hypothetical protein
VDKPVACSLEANALATRLDEIAAVGRDALVAREGTGGSHLLRFRADGDTAARLERIVDAERECCSFLTMEVRRVGDELELTIVAPAEGEGTAEALAAGFAAGAD